MYKFTQYSDLNFLIGERLQQICYGLFDLQLNFVSVNISIYSEMNYFINDKLVFTSKIEKLKENNYVLNSLLDETILMYEIKENKADLEVVFTGNKKIFIYGAEKEFECYSISSKQGMFVV